MTVQRLSSLQWFALLAGAAMLAAGHILGIGLTYAECNVGGARWGIANDPWEIAILATAAFVMVLSAVASVTVLVRTQETSYDEDDPPLSRIRFFAIAALVANVAFTVVMMLDLVGNVFNAVCRQG
jgi:hypothetical protein